LVTYAKNTLINDWDAQGSEKNEGVNSLGWASQEEESWRNFGIVAGEYQWVV
jgi:hypothetical protein